MKVKVTDREGGQHELTFHQGDTLMVVLTDEDLGIRAECGGCCACATCHVYIAPAWFAKLPAPSDEEIAMLDEAFEVETNPPLLPGAADAGAGRHGSHRGPGLGLTVSGLSKD